MCEAGIATAIRLKEQLGERIELTILEKAAAPGGVWRDSRWPGAGRLKLVLYRHQDDLTLTRICCFAGVDVSGLADSACEITQADWSLSTM